MMMKVEKLDYHRNGVGGLGFYVGVVAEQQGQERRRMLVVRFPDVDKEAGAIVCAAFDLAKLAEEDITFGSNSWRGDNYDEVMDAAIDAVRRGYFGDAS